MQGLGVARRAAGRAAGRPACHWRHFAASGFGGFPFGGGFPGQGRTPGGGERLYKLLEVDKTATERDIKQAYKKLAMKHHPDRGGDEATFKEISKAYEVLTDMEKRQIYDAYGEQGLEGMEQGGGGGPHPGMDPFDLFSSIFGFNAGGERRGQRARPVTKDSTYELQLSLEELYAGTRREIKYTRDVLCGLCDGKGGHDVIHCDRCDGTGVQVTMQQLGIMVQQVQSQCGACDGRGFRVPRGKVCEGCKGKSTLQEKKTFNVSVEPGAQDGVEFRFRGQADEKLGHDTGDVVIVVREKPHDTFQRLQESLLISKRVSLAEALCGFQFSVPFLDGEPLVIRSNPGEVTKPGTVMKIAGRGMPRTHGQRPGDLFLRLDVDFPASIPAGSREALLVALDGEAPPEQPPEGAVAGRALGARQVEELNRRLEQAREGPEQQQPECVQQ